MNSPSSKVSGALQRVRATSALEHGGKLPNSSGLGNDSAALGEEPIEEVGVRERLLPRTQTDAGELRVLRDAAQPLHHREHRAGVGVQTSSSRLRENASPTDLTAPSPRHPGVSVRAPCLRKRCDTPGA